MRLPQDAACLLLGAMLSVEAWSSPSAPPARVHDLAQHALFACGQCDARRAGHDAGFVE